MVSSTKRLDKILEPFFRSRCPTIDEQGYVP
jgi:hypothetical protein